MHTPSWMTDELTDLAGLARTFFERECAPHEEEWRAQQHVDRSVWLRAGEQGLLCLGIGEEYGGGGGTFAHEAIITIEQIRADAASFGGMLHSAIVAPYLETYGSEELKRTWLPRMARGESIGAIAMTEPGTGSDLRAIRTRARRDGDEYVISGAKTFISNGFLADIVVVACATEGPDGPGLSLILVEADREGFSRGRNLVKVGRHGQDTCELSFDEVRVPVTNLLGEHEGQGFTQLTTQLAQERLVLGVESAAAMETAVRLAAAYAKERSAFGAPIMSFQNTKFVLAECDTLASVAWAFLDDCIEKHLRGDLSPAHAAKAKWWLTEQQCVVTDRCLQIFGGYGYMEEYPISRLFVDARVQKIYGGTNEVMKTIIAKEL